MSFFFLPGRTATLTAGGGSVKANADGSVTITAASGQSVTITGAVFFGIGETQVLVSGSTISPNAYVVPVSAAGVITLTATPAITTGTNGQIIKIVNVGSNAITLQANALLSGSNLRMNTLTTAVLSPLNSIEFMYLTSVDQWVQCNALVSVV